MSAAMRFYFKYAMLANTYEIFNVSENPTETTLGRSSIMFIISKILLIDGNNVIHRRYVFFSVYCV